ncbi:MAG: hypothetical protein NTW16_06125 [Bacteroidetes bacterium]|nr:hypothetical protein [Bacteroidota bacterium]
MTTYFALTIGPIYSTFAQAKKTRAVWAASYFFSWFIKETLVRTKRQGFDIMLPFHKEIRHGKYGAGMYADRLYYIENEKGNAVKLITCLDGIISDLASDICMHTAHKDQEAVSAFLKSYLNLHVVTLSFDPDNEDIAPLKMLNDLLDNKELGIRYSFDGNVNPLLDYLELETSNQTLLVMDAFPGATGRHFRSIPEISSTSLERLEESGYRKYLNLSFSKPGKAGTPEFEFLDELKKSVEFRTAFRPYHKYFGVLLADGDNISDLLKKISGDRNDLLKFSEKLMEFAGLAEKEIWNYGGNGIYLGGEDVLAFIPLACKHPEKGELQTVFDLIDKLDTLFGKTIGDYATEKKVSIPTLSYGLMLSYSKHPLKEGMHLAHKLLESSKDEKKHRIKNTLGLRFQKHSGQVIECFIEKGGDKQKSWNEIRDFTGKYTRDTLKEKQASFQGRPVFYGIFGSSEGRQAGGLFCQFL